MSSDGLQQYTVAITINLHQSIQSIGVLGHQDLFFSQLQAKFQRNSMRFCGS